MAGGSRADTGLGWEISDGYWSWMTIFGQILVLAGDFRADTFGILPLFAATGKSRAEGIQIFEFGAVTFGRYLFDI